MEESFYSLACLSVILFFYCLGFNIGLRLERKIYKKAKLLINIGPVENKGD